MSNIIFNKKLQPSNDKRFFGLPVRVIKVLLRFCDKPELNHFERAIMALSLYQRYSIADLSEMLQLKIELIELIINNLKKKSFMDEEQKVTQKGEEILKNFHKNFKDEVCYVFYDLNRKCLLQEYCSPSDIIEIEGEKNSFNLENDAFSEEVIFTPIIKSNENFKIDNDIEGYIKRDIFYNNDKTLINVEILNVDYNKYFFISYIESSKDLSDNRWIIANPVTLEQDTALYDYFYENTNVESINKLIMGIIQFKKKSFNEDENKLYENVKQRLFKIPIKPQHEKFIIPLMKVIKIIKDSSEHNIDEKRQKIESIRDAMIELGDLYELILYEAAMESKCYNAYESIIRKYKDDNKIILIEIAKNIGFDISDDAKKLFLVENRSIRRLIANPEKAELNNCLSWNLTIANQNENYFLNNLAIKYPNFINLLYEFKRFYRDANKHDINLETLSPKIYFELLWDMLAEAFKYKLNNKKLNDIISSSNSIMDYSYSYEYLRIKLGNKMFDSNNSTITEIKTSLISMFDNYTYSSASYLKFAYNLVEAITRIIANHLKKNLTNKPKIMEDLFLDTLDVKKFLEENGFEMNSYDVFGNKIEDSFNFMGQSYFMVNGFKDGFKNSNLRTKVLAIISILKTNSDKVSFFNEYKSLFVITSIMGYTQQHKQVHEFDKDKAKIIVDEVIKLTDFLVNKKNDVEFK